MKTQEARSAAGATGNEKIIPLRARPFAALSEAALWRRIADAEGDQAAAATFPAWREAALMLIALHDERAARTVDGGRARRLAVAGGETR